MASLLRFADSNYFLSGTFLEDIKGNHPILVDPLWKSTKLETQFRDILLPQTNANQSFSLVTSGSTGSPKLVWKDWDEVQKEVDVWLEETELQSFLKGVEEIHVQVPLCHLYGLLWGYLIPKALGLQTIVGQKETNHPSKLSITSAPILQMTLSNGSKLPERAIVSGMKFPVPLARDLRDKGGISVLEIYGSTETGGLGYRDPLRQNRFQFLQEIQFQFQNVGETAELCVKSPFVSKRYYTFVSNEWVLQEQKANEYYATGDLGEHSDLGFFLLGRKDRIIKHKGKRVSLDRIESEILGLRLDGIFVCVPIFHESGDSIGLLTNSDLEVDVIFQMLRRELPDSHVPRVIVKQTSIPKLPNGKTDYTTITSICKETFLKQIAEKTIRETVRNINSDTSVSEIIQSILGYEPKENQHLVYDCGMDSILYTELFLKLEQKIGAKIPEEDKQTSYFASVAGIEEYIAEKIYLQ